MRLGRGRVMVSRIGSCGHVRIRMLGRRRCGNAGIAGSTRSARSTRQAVTNGVEVNTELGCHLVDVSTVLGGEF